MTSPDRTIYLQHHRCREAAYTLIGSSEALRHFAESLSHSLSALRTPIEERLSFSLSNVNTADADGSKRDVLLEIRIEPSPDWITVQRKRTKRRDWAVISGFIVVFLLAIIGGFSVLMWLSSRFD